MRVENKVKQKPNRGFDWHEVVSEIIIERFKSINDDINILEADESLTTGEEYEEK